MARTFPTKSFIRSEKKNNHIKNYRKFFLHNNNAENLFKNC